MFRKSMSKHKSSLAKKRKKWFFVLGGVVIFFVLVGLFIGNGSKQTILLNTLSVVNATTKLLPIDRDTKDAIATSNAISHYILKEDGVTRTYLLLLQNNY